MVSLSVSLAGFIGFAIELASSKLEPPWQLNKNPALKMLGQFSWLTFQTNCIGTIYFAVAVLSSLGFGLDAFVIQLYPLVFALGSFLTVSYYALDHFNPENLKRRLHFAQNGFPWIGTSAHTQHALALPLVVMHALCLQVAMTPDDTTILLTVGGYLAFYLGFTFVNKKVSGAWVYPVFDDAQKAGGRAGPYIFACILGALVVGLAYVGCWLLAA